MGEYEIRGVRQDTQNVIIEVVIANNLHPIMDVVNWIRNGTHSFFTNKHGYRADVYPKQHPLSKRWFLTTDPDNTRENNLDFLPKF